ncbi:uncharacterized protein LOC144497639 [Mustelus asterias]
MSALNKMIGVKLMLMILLCGVELRFTVLQYPHSISATEGDSVTMNCTYGGGLGQVPVGQVSWSRGASRENATDLEEDLQLMRRLEKSKSHHFTERKIFINISDVRQYDSATYYCTVKAMTGQLSVGNGTKLQVKRQVCVNESVPPPVAGLLVGKCILIVFLIAFGVVACLVKPKNPDCHKGLIMQSTTSKVTYEFLLSSRARIKMQTICTWTFLNFMAILLHIDHGLRGDIEVFQSPDAINVTEGDSVQLNCTFELNQKVGRVLWRRASENMELSARNIFYQSRIQKSGPKLFAQSMAFIRINNVAKMDSDFYYCEVEVPGFGSGNGTGTQLIVTNT